MAVVTAVLLSPVFVGGKNFSTVTGHQRYIFPWAAFSTTELLDPITSDQADAAYPWQATLYEAADHGTMPYWEETTFNGGYPLLANGQSAPLYLPQQVLVRLVPLQWFHVGMLLVHLPVGGWLGYLLARRWGAGFAGALYAGTAWLLGSFTTAWLHFDMIIPQLVWFPAMLLAIVRVDRKGDAAGIAALAVSVAAAATCGHVVFGAVSVAGAASLAAFVIGARVLRHRQRPDRRAVGRLAVALGVGFGAGLALAAPILLPTAANAAQSARTFIGPDDLEFYDFLSGPDELRNLVLPPRAPYVDALLINNGMLFLGTATIPLAVVGALRRPRSWDIWCVVVAVGIVVVASVAPIANAILTVLPAAGSFRPFGRAYLYWQLPVALLAARGVGIVQQRGLLRRHRRVAAVGFVALLGFTTTQLLALGKAANPTFPDAEAASIYPTTPLLEALQQHQREQPFERILPMREDPPDGSYRSPILFANEHAVHGIVSAGGYDATLPERTATVVRLLSGEPVDAVTAVQLRGALNVSYFLGRTRLDLAPRWGVGVVVTPPGLGPAASDAVAAATGDRPDPLYDGPDGTVLDIRTDNGPWLVGDVRTATATGLDEVLAAGFDPAREVVVESEQLDDVPELPDATPSGDVRTARRGVNELDVEVTTDAPALLVIPDNWDPGWRATVDGRSTPVIRVNYHQLAVAVPEGTTGVHLSYRPPGLRTGYVLAALAAAALAAIAAWEVRGRRQVSRGGSPPAQHRSGSPG